MLISWCCPALQSYQFDDMQKSAQLLRQAFPKSAIQTFVPPANMANEDTLVAMQAQNLSILSTMGTLGCNPWKAPPPRYNYMYAPCQQGDHGPYCIPPNDMYFTLDGFQALNGSGNLIYSAPTGSANHVANDPTSGLTVNTTLGADACGCGDPSQSGGRSNPGICSIIGSAKNNAAKSSGLHWTVSLHTLRLLVMYRLFPAACC